MTATIQIKANHYYVVLNWKSDNHRQQKWLKTGLEATEANRLKAERLCGRFLAEYEYLEDLTPDNVLFSDYLLSYHMHTHKYSIRSTTAYTYAKILENTICPYFRELRVKLINLKPKHIQDFYTQKMNDSVSPASGNTIYHYHAIINSALNYAVTTGRIRDNPAERVRLPRKVMHIADCLNTEKIKQLLKAVKGTVVETPVSLGLWQGLRKAEILGLQWQDIDFENNTLSVNGTLIKEDGRLKYVTEAKTPTSLRTLTMTGQTCAYLQALKDRQEEQREQLGEKYDTTWDGFICRDEQGRILRPDRASRALRNICKEHGIPNIGFRGLRHSNLSLLANQGIDMKMVQVWAGHSSYNTTANIYSHILQSSIPPLASTITEVLSAE